ncbi:hypothetical protein AQI88_18540 [Streptomyces cellostaticus]|uniref:Histidine decarboxylase n=1 Tax=Streptomyces cellostaticus TaxID=67285 RepID=A0A101NL02_9ACTN|nr:histidine decarboxylase [Streptomyces cellostaticus]KUM94847.1 hypothetical protein AQI88_18540 [Streptomyces cellostaticus]GHI06341.1 hypothetical protein Scel_46620 [Streptomyces cellostaticus]
MTTKESPSQAAPEFPFGATGETWLSILESEGLADGQPAYVTSPLKEPKEVYPPEPGIDAADFELQPRGLPPERRKKALDAMATYLINKRDHMLGYQFNQDTDGAQLDLSRFLDCHVNNMGDPFDHGGYKPNTRAAERAVLDYYAALWKGKWPHNPKDPESYWGYMISMGSTEANLYAMWNARDYLAGKALLKPKTKDDSLHFVQAAPPKDNPNALIPIAFYSQDTHYSFGKAMRVLGIENFYAAAKNRYPNDDCPLGGEWPTEVPSKPSSKKGLDDGPGEIDIDKLVPLVSFFVEKGHPILISLNFGSTFKGAHDDVELVCKHLLPIFDKKGLVERELEIIKGKPEVRRGFWIHVDGALGAGYGPFMRMASEKPEVFGWTPEAELPAFDFGLKVHAKKLGKDIDMVSSISMSGHKWPGAPWPCGVYMTKVKYQLAPPAEVQVIGAKDTTFAGSRNGFSPLVMWDHLAQFSYKDQVERIRVAQEMAQYLERRLKELKAPVSLNVARTPGSLSVRFRRPNARICAKWSLSSVGQNVHAFAMPSTTREKIDELIFDLQASDAFTITKKPPIVELEEILAAVEAVELAPGAISWGAVAFTGRGME